VDQKDPFWLPKYIGQERYEYFLRLGAGNPRRALGMYLYDVKLRDALRPELEAVEISLRTRYHAILQTMRPAMPLWLLDGKLPVRELLERHAEKVLRRLSDGHMTSAEAVENLSFGFWRQLTAAKHEQSLWIPYLRHAYPAGTSRAQTHAAVDEIVRLRNRVHHYNPVLELPLGNYFHLMLWILDRVNPELGQHRRDVSQIPKIVDQYQLTE